MIRQAPLAILLFAFITVRAQDLSGCVVIEDDSERLHCYDTVSGRVPVLPGQQEPAIASALSIWDQHLMTDAAREPYTLTTHRPTYVLLTRLDSFNDEPYAAFEPADRFRNEELKLNISLQTKLAENIFGANGDVWVAYTQTSYWQVFSDELSSPFRETHHNPEVRLDFLTDLRLPGVTLRGAKVGVMHDSNGQGGSLSRSWNRAFAELHFVSGALGLSVRPWVFIFDLSDNPDIEDYYGDLDMRASWERRDHLLSAMVRNPFDSRYGAELSWSFPIAGRLRGLVQWYYGYGENPIDYNFKTNRLSVGVLMSDWL